MDQQRLLSPKKHRRKCQSSLSLPSPSSVTSGNPTTRTCQPGLKGGIGANAVAEVGRSWLVLGFGAHSLPSVFKKWVLKVSSVLNIWKFLSFLELLKILWCQIEQASGFCWSCLWCFWRRWVFCVFAIDLLVSKAKLTWVRGFDMKKWYGMILCWLLVTSRNLLGVTSATTKKSDLPI